MLAHGPAQADDSLTHCWIRCLGLSVSEPCPKVQNLQSARVGSYSVALQVPSECPACLTATFSLLLERVGRPPVVFFVARQRLLAAKLMLAWHVLARHVHCFCHSSKTKSQQAH